MLCHTHTHTHIHIYTTYIYVLCMRKFLLCFFVRHFLWLRAHKKRIKWLQHGIKNAPKSANRERERVLKKRRAEVRRGSSRMNHLTVDTSGWSTIRANRRQGMPKVDEVKACVHKELYKEGRKKWRSERDRESVTEIEI